VVEGARLERVWAGNCPVSSNLTLSARLRLLQWLRHIRGFVWASQETSTKTAKSGVPTKLKKTNPIQ